MPDLIRHPGYQKLWKDTGFRLSPEWRFQNLISTYKLLLFLIQNMDLGAKCIGIFPEYSDNAEKPDELETGTGVRHAKGKDQKQAS